jgi:hypothetical protein
LFLITCLSFPSSIYSYLSWPTELLCKIILLRVREDFFGPPSSYDAFHPWWLNIRVSGLFRDILARYPIPYSSLCTTFHGDHNDSSSFRVTSALFDRRVSHIDALCHATPFRVTLHASFGACGTLSSTSVNVALDSLRSACVLIPCNHSFHLSCLDHAVDLPAFPRLTHAYLSLRTSDPNVSPYRYTYLSPVFAP